ncbi:hypothetical protein GGR56DRAFT_184405 [Xylariaceae sp. FL0804]|nr:hypothetical protein GGR56DRAFT_184405 [Xylariaceae sp. FL0804]
MSSTEIKMASFALLPRFKAVFEPVLYGFNRTFGKSSAVEWGVWRNQVATLDKARKYKLDFSWGPDPWSLMQMGGRRGSRAAVAWLLTYGFPMESLPFTSVITTGNSINSSSGNGTTGNTMTLHSVLRSVNYKKSVLYSTLARHATPEREAIAILLLSAGACQNFRGIPLNIFLIHPVLHVAAKRGCLSVMIHLVKRMGVDVGLEQPQTRWTALHAAATIYHNIPAMETLLDLGADIEADTCGQTPLMKAIEHGCMTNALWLINAGADVNPRIASPTQASPLHACARGTEYFYVPSMMREAKEAVFRRLIVCGANLHCLFAGRTPLAQAIVHGDVFSVYALIQAGVDVRKPALGYKLPLDLIWRMYPLNGVYRRDAVDRMIEVTRLLVAAGAQMDKPAVLSQLSPLETAVLECGRTARLLDTCLRLANPSTVSEGYIDELFSFAVAYRHFPACKMIFRHGVKVLNPGAVKQWATDLLDLQDHVEREEFRFLLGVGISDHDIRDLLEKALSKNSNLEALHMILDTGCLSRASASDKSNYLTEFVSMGLLDEARRLCLQGAEVNHLTPVCLKSGKREFITALFSPLAAAIETKAVQAELRGSSDDDDGGSDKDSVRVNVGDSASARGNIVHYRGANIQWGVVVDDDHYDDDDMADMLLGFGADPFFRLGSPSERLRYYRSDAPEQLAPECLAPFEYVLRRGQFARARRFWDAWPPALRPREPFHVPCVLARAPQMVEFQRSLWRHRLDARVPRDADRFHVQGRMGAASVRGMLDDVRDRKPPWHN